MTTFVPCAGCGATLSTGGVYSGVRAVCRRCAEDEAMGRVSEQALIEMTDDYLGQLLGVEIYERSGTP